MAMAVTLQHLLIWPTWQPVHLDLPLWFVAFALTAFASGVSSATCFAYILITQMSASGMCFLSSEVLMSSSIAAKHLVVSHTSVVQTPPLLFQRLL